ncbi:MAG: hypothetical protein QOE05_343 [Actinomycetota bacterium]|jgi:hypothetical protein|nr:hypothetical protein [Actinomycetota bacterium]
MRRAVSLLVGACLLLGLTGCNDKKPQAAPAPSPSADSFSPSPLPTCAPAKPTVYKWPKQIPQELPRLPGAVLESSKPTSDGLFLVFFSTHSSLRDDVLFIVKKLPAAGFQLGRGDAEPAEADAPFNKGDLRGVLRGASIGICETKWVLAVARATRTSPLLPSHTGPSPSPLPFG